uniref:Calmodulin-like protein 10 n=1 Tax=Carica papaya TaxID=3649 RepID=A0A3S8V2J7_CARPA|nr:calmodulin-like protein 10 [Carica papaya]
MARLARRRALISQNVKIDELKMMFEGLATNDDKTINKEELKQLFDDLGALTPSFMAERAIAYGSKKGENKISFEELKDLLIQAPQFGISIKT